MDLRMALTQSQKESRNFNPTTEENSEFLVAEFSGQLGLAWWGPLSFWPTELQINKIVFVWATKFVIIYYGSNSKVA